MDPLEFFDTGLIYCKTGNIYRKCSWIYLKHKIRGNFLRMNVLDIILYGCELLVAQIGKIFMSQKFPVLQYLLIPLLAPGCAGVLQETSGM